MQLPHSKTRQTYIEQVKIIEANLKDATSGEQNDALLAQVQKRLDSLAEKYQYSEEIGAARYKLYELQALVHYFMGDDDSALDFINQAIEMRGDSYARAEKLKTQLLTKTAALDTAAPKNLTKQERRKKLIGLEGWLAFFIVGLGIAILYNVIQIFTYPSAFSEIESVRSQAPGFVSAMMPALWFEVFQFAALAAVAIWLIVLLAQHKQLAKHIAIAFLVANIVLGIIDYAWASSIFSEYNINVDSEMSKQGSSIGRAIISSCIWIPYFLVSKRVKATLIK
jgi:hypothetical protein